MRLRFALVLFAPLLGSCGGAVYVPQDALLEPNARRAAYLPDDTDRAARDVARAALGEDAAAARAALAAFEATERLRAAVGEPPSGLDGYARHLVDSTSDDEIAYRLAASELLEQRDLDPALRRAIEIEVADDPLVLANKRIGEGRRARIARGVNSISAALGRSIFTAVVAPARLAQAIVGLALNEYLDDPISLQERQALEHWKRYVDAHPETPEAVALVARIEAMNDAWFATKRRRSVRAAEQALERGQDDLALLLAVRALRYAPDDARSQRLRDEAEERLDATRIRRAQTLAVSNGALLDAGDPLARDLSLVLLGGGDIAAASDALLASDPAEPLALGARFSRATADAEAGFEARSWEALEEIASNDDDAPPIAREARVVLDSPTQNPWQAFRSARHRDARQTAALVALGPLALGPRDRDLPRSIEWLLEAPTLLPTLGGIPWRLVQVGIAPSESRAPAIAAERYLARFPKGEHATELQHWVIENDIARKRHLRAYGLAEESGVLDPEELSDLAEKAAKQALEMAEKQNRRDIRLAILQSAAESFPETESGGEAMRKVREEIETATEQRVRISRGFLIENPALAGPDGLGLRPDLLDGSLRNGELHPLGVTLLGGQAIEVAFVAAGATDEDPPETSRQLISASRLSRLVSLLEETSLRNALLDPLAEQGADAPRDFFFERARLGVADAPDPRPTAYSRFAFVGVREKYNMVRSRESILPIEIVISGSLPDLGLGAFPRLRMPKETPDAMLYK